MGKANGGGTITWADGTWLPGNPPVLGPRHHAMWLSSIVFDGARALRGWAPDLDRHCARVVSSARHLGLEPVLSGAEIEEIAWDGIGRFAADADLYICPMMYAEEGFICPDPASTRFVMTVFEAALPAPGGFSACLSSFRRPAPDMAPTEAKASCLYPNIARIGREVTAKGFDMGVVCDPDGNVAEFTYTNLFMVKDGIVHTPVPNGTFLNGITRQRVIALLGDAGTEVIERTLGFEELLEADEVFATGNYAKVHPCTRLENRTFQVGPVYEQARSLYFEFDR